jgi:hypothetical protein
MRKFTVEKITRPKKIIQHPNQFLFFEEKSLFNFDVICEELRKKFNCTYLSYALEMVDGKRIHYYSNREWQEEFTKENLITNCPLLKFGRESNTSMLAWNSLSGHFSKQQLYVMDARKSHDIGNGIGTKNIVYGMHEISTFASTIDNKDFVRTFSQNIRCFKKYVSELRTLAIASMVVSGWLHPSKINFILQDAFTKNSLSANYLH